MIQLPIAFVDFAAVTCIFPLRGNEVLQEVIQCWQTPPAEVVIREAYDCPQKFP